MAEAVRRGVPDRVEEAVEPSEPTVELVARGIELRRVRDIELDHLADVADLSEAARRSPREREAATEP